MRKIKFRAWNSQEKKMIDLQKITPLAMDAALLSLGARGLFLPFDKDMILMQFTGLHDKNGKEIYESDIVQWDGFDGMHTQVVRWDDDEAMFLPNHMKNDVEVIGNIYEQTL